MMYFGYVGDMSHLVGKEVFSFNGEFLGCVVGSTLNSLAVQLEDEPGFIVSIARFRIEQVYDQKICLKPFDVDYWLLPAEAWTSSFDDITSLAG